MHLILPSPQPSQKDNNPSPRTTTLASLVKGEVLSPEKIRATTGGITPYPHQPSQTRTITCFAPPHLPPLLKVRCCRPKKFGRLPEGLLYTHQPLHPPQPLQNHNRPSPRTISLPPLSKVRCCRPKKFGRLPEGLLPIRTNPPKPALSLAPHNILTPLAKGELLLLSFAQPTIEDSSHQHRRKHFAY